MLQRAFGPEDGPVPEAIDGNAAAALARRLDLAPRLRARAGASRLRRELGDAAASHLVAAHGVAALSAERLLAAARSIAEAAAAARLPITFLKGVALHVSGRVAAGARFFSDVDVLAPAGRAEALQSCLQGAGFRSAGSPAGGDHELPKLVSAAGDVVEVHHYVPGLRAGGEHGYATLDALAAEGQLVPFPGWPGEVFTPSTTVLVAHALVHGIAQSGFSPQAYPMTRMLADLVDLGLGKDDGARLLDPAYVAVARELSREEVEAARHLCALLVAGQEPLTGRPETPESRLLAHALAGPLEARYQSWMKIRALAAGPSLLPRPLAWARAVGRAVVIGDNQAQAIYGRPRRKGSAKARRLARPFDLAWRLVRALGAGASLRRGPVRA